MSGYGLQIWWEPSSFQSGLEGPCCQWQRVGGDQSTSLASRALESAAPVSPRTNCGVLGRLETLYFNRYVKGIIMAPPSQVYWDDYSEATCSTMSGHIWVPYFQSVYSPDRKMDNLKRICYANYQINFHFFKPKHPLDVNLQNLRNSGVG